MRDHNPEEATSDFSELRTLLVDMQTATQTSIQQLSEMLATHLDALTTALAPRLDPQAEHGVQAPLPPAQRRFPPLQHPQQHLPPPQPQHQRHLPAPFQHQRQQNQHRRYNPRGDDIHNSFTPTTKMSYIDKFILKIYNAEITMITEGKIVLRLTYQNFTMVSEVTISSIG